jgi:hypothetical protein
MDDIVSRPVLDGPDLDAAIEHARAALGALLRVPAGGDGAGYPKVIAEARALLGTLLDHRLALATARIGTGRIHTGRMDTCDVAAVAAARADRDEAIAVTGALLYWLAPGDPAWPGVALTVARLSYDRYRDSWPGAQPPDPDDLDAACDLLLRAARREDADERTTLYIVLALRDRQRLVACPTDAVALESWTRRLRAFPRDRGGVHFLVDLELASSGLARAGSWAPGGLRPLRLAGRPCLAALS